MRDTLRARMGWLHGWVGFLAGIPLFLIFITGTISVFDVELGRWMEPEIAPRPLVAPTPQALEKVGAAWAGLRSPTVTPFLNLPFARDPVIRLLHYDGHEFVGPAFDPRTGAALNARPTVGREFFYTLHFTLRLGRDRGRQVVSLLGLALLVTLGSGILIHLRSLLPDLLLFRPFAAHARAWMDAHVLAGVLFLPFLLTMALTGVIIHAGSIFPEGPHDRHGHARPAQRLPPLPPVAPLISRGEAEFGAGKLGFLLLNPDGISVVRADGASFLLTRDEARFAYGDGRFLGVTRHDGTIAQTKQVFDGVHFARWAPPGLRWLYFLSGAAGTALIAAGLVLFLMRYRRHHAQAWIFRLAEALTLAATTGFTAAALGLLWLNRLVPARLADRIAWETDGFFALWLFALLHALASALTGRARRGWRQQLGWIAALGAALPLLDLATRPGWTRHLGANAFIAVDGVALALAAAAFLTQRRLREAA
ncbi:PepSY-associated TM helix domain-containing protein [Acidomonas methanolica]|uniref:PepSY-associated TM helix domain-containing protein n=1 Tax=Acidomonas methanolica NBRC 104435 TaxID=1231351 RepID=A0A023DAE0_ACIMT|nr:PepSY-associated TM helix domain-containing protein [Acidomonas methanolica]MCQ9155517.1 PepSY domain-containing protein [Acidomonas methanolica]TCS27484.1 putative iron-regulated membrane protein [Acidomonas methanolica]GAJ30786.1 hypothetical protein Amme_361_003 [Acidomonas methanolica NBRC 104435]GBQ53637.1 putative iron-regulated membrane protein [Acidomonas methanolica]GEK98609.1 iron uptake protein [Acidomonas methanolica NBRC 104435]